MKHNSYAASSDFLICALVSSIWYFNILMFPTWAWFSFIFPIVFTTFVIFYVSISPVLQSQLVSPDFSTLLPPRTRLLRGRTDHMYIVDLWIRRYVVLPRNIDITFLDSDPSRLLHEIGHLEAGDGRLFTWVYPLVVANIVLGLFLLLKVEENVVYVVFRAVLTAFASAEVDHILATLIFWIGTILFLLLTISVISVLTLRDREFFADKYAATRHEEFGGYLKDNIFFEEYTSSQNKIDGILNWVFHPTFLSRYQSLSSPKGNLSFPSLPSGILVTYVFYFGIITLTIPLNMYLSKDQFFASYFEINFPGGPWFIVGLVTVMIYGFSTYVSSIFANARLIFDKASYLKKTLWFLGGAVLAQLVLLLSAGLVPTDMVGGLTAPFRDCRSLQFGWLQFPGASILLLALFWGVTARKFSTFAASSISHGFVGVVCVAIPIVLEKRCWEVFFLFGRILG